jgi:translation initiation factor 1
MSKKKNDWKDRQGVVYSTQSDYNYTNSSAPDKETPERGRQNLRVILDTSGRAGKQVTLVCGFIGSSQDLESIAKFLKSGCGAGGSVKDGNILIQGDIRDKVVTLLQSAGYKAKRSG